MIVESLYRHVLMPSFDSLWKRRRTFTYWRSLEASQWWSKERLDELQFERLRQLIDYCAEHTPFYRNLWNAWGLKPERLTSLADFNSWPVVTREQIREHRADIETADGRFKTVSKSTGGSSGTPLSFRIDVDANDRRNAATYRGYAWGGAPPGTKQSYLWGVPLSPQGSVQKTRTWIYDRYLHRRDMMNVFDLNEENAIQLAHRISRFRPDVLVGYTNPLYFLARVIVEQGLQIYAPRSIIVGAEKLHPFQRAVIEKAFQATVFETYGSREFTLIGAECNYHAGLHLTKENLLVEILDDDNRPAAPGQQGNIVITDLFNRATPFVRYRIGDRAIAGLDTCACGRGLPLLREVTGRQLDLLTIADGRVLAGEFFPHLLKDFAAIRQFQVRQTRIDVIELRLVVGPQWNAEIRQSLKVIVQRALGPHTQVVLHEVDEIPLTQAGKFQVVIGLSNVDKCAISPRGAA
jgi:phenylacetate-CoA ligase